MKTLIQTSLLFICVITLGVASASASSPKSVVEYTNTVNSDDSAYIANSIIITGQRGKTRALCGFYSSPSLATSVATCADFYKTTLGDSINVYMVIAPSAAAYYTPKVANSWTRNQGKAINAAYEAIKSDVKIVDVYSTLAKHVNEDIYLRTDHHWAPLAAYYVAEEFAKMAGVEFKDLSHYETVEIPHFVGSMYLYSKDESVLRSPETFVYHKPLEAEYTTTYIDFRTNGAYGSIVGESRPKQGEYFRKMYAGAAYSTFMGGDNKITQVRTDVKNNRRMLIVKDSFGNAIPGYLFYSFEEIHVVDFRYFNRNLKTYIESNEITDVVIECNIAFACSSKTMNRYKRLLIK